MTVLKNLITRLILPAAVVCLLAGCIKTTPDETIRELYNDGFTFSWTTQKGEYWDEFSASKEKRSKKIVVNRRKVKRRPQMNEGDPHTVKLLDDGTLEVNKPDE